MATWHDDAFFGIHYDFHAQLHDTEIGARLTKEHLIDRLSKTKPDWIQCDCKGHAGWTSWHTKVGSTSPGVINDSVLIHREATKELGIKLGMHYSGVMDTRAVELHPDWAALDALGKPYDRGNTCRLSGYADELMIPPMLELVQDFDVDGFWIDGDNWGSRPCWCDRCIDAFRKDRGSVTIPRSPGQPFWAEWLAFHRNLFVSYVTKYADAVHAVNPDCAICSNWMYTLRQPEPIAAPVDYLSGDYTWDWGADRAALEGRMLDMRDVSWDLMVWGFSIIFTREDEFAGIYQMKNSLHLKQEVSEVLALGGALMVYVNPERNGWLVGWQNETIAEVAAFARERKQWCFKTESASEAAVLHPVATHYAGNEPLYNFGKAHLPIEGALHALLENHISTDLVTDDATDADLGQYELLVVPERQPLDDKSANLIKHFAERGGCVIMSGSTLCRDHADLVGATFKADIDNHGPSHGLMHMAAGRESVGFAGVWSVVEPAKGTEVMKHALKSREPDEPDSNRPLVTRIKFGKGTIVAVHGPLFWNYWRKHYPNLRKLIGELIEDSGFSPSVQVKAGPELEIICRRGKGKLYINLINRGAGETLGPTRVMIETLPPAVTIEIQVSLSTVPKGVKLRPSGAALQCSYEEGIATIRVPEVPIYEIVEIDL